jgi:hypothetical protein
VSNPFEILARTECRVKFNWIYFILLAMAPYGVVSQSLALEQWRA